MDSRPNAHPTSRVGQADDRVKLEVKNRLCLSSSPTTPMKTNVVAFSTTGAFAAFVDPVCDAGDDPDYYQEFHC
jgi:hypothetical protein